MEFVKEVSDAEKVVFKKKIKKLAEYKGSGTELISVYIPPDTDRSSVMDQLTEEISQSSNIKDPKTRKNVQGALRRITNFLKQINFDIPERGLVVFAGNVSEVAGKSDIKLFTIQPIQKLGVKLYWCDSKFHLTPLKEMIEPSEIYGLLTIDKNDATVAMLKGKKYEIVGKFRSRVAGKQRAGGQSAKRFEHLREEAEHNFYKKISEVMNSTFVPHIQKLKGIIIGGPGITKNYFLNEGLMDHRIRERILGKVDTSYTDEYGIKEMVHKASEILRETDIIREKEKIQHFFGEIAKNALVAYGEKEVIECLDSGKVSELVVSEGIEKMVYKFKCSACGNEEEFVTEKAIDLKEKKCSKCNSKMELLEEEIDFIDYLMEKAEKIGASTVIISTDTDEGKQFLKGFGGVGAFLRYK